MNRKIAAAKGTPLEKGEGTCFGSLVWCCKISKPCYLRDEALSRAKLSEKEYMELKKKLAEKILQQAIRDPRLRGDLVGQVAPVAVRVVRRLGRVG